MNVKQSAVSGLAWTTASFGARQAFQTLVGILVARILLPADFGVFALALLTIGFLALFRDLGLTAAIVRSPAVDDRLLSSAFWTNVALGLALSALLALGAPALAAFFSEPRLAGPLMLLAPTFFLNTASAVQGGLLTRSRDYRRLALREGSAALVAGLTSLTLAYLGFGLYALVAQTIVGGLLSAVFLWTAVPWRPRLEFDWGATRALLGFGLPLAGSNLMAYLVRRLDNLLVGRFLGATSLGLYGFAYAILQTPITMVQSILGRVMFPEMSRIQDDHAHVRAVYVGSLRYIAAILWLPLGGLLVLAPVAIPLVYGPRWEEAVPLVQVFCALAFVQAIGTTVGWIYNSQGKTRQQFVLTLVFGLAFLVSFVVGLRWGILGVALSYASVNVLLAWPYNRLAFSIIGLRTSTVAGALRWIALALAEMVAVLYVLRVGWIRLVPLHEGWFVPVGIVVGTAAYASTLWATEPKLVRDVFALPRLLRKGRRGPPAPPTASPLGEDPAV